MRAHGCRRAAAERGAPRWHLTLLNKPKGVQRARMERSTKRRVKTREGAAFDGGGVSERQPWVLMREERCWCC